MEEDSERRQIEFKEKTDFWKNLELDETLGLAACSWRVLINRWH